MYNKFIITLDGELKFGNVYLHKDLIPYGEDSCHGGGLWRIDNQNGRIILYGRSFDFGLPQFEYYKKCRKADFPLSLGYPVYYLRTFGEEEILEEIIV